MLFRSLGYQTWNSARNGHSKVVDPKWMMEALSTAEVYLEASIAIQKASSIPGHPTSRNVEGLMVLTRTHMEWNVKLGDKYPALLPLK